MLVLFKLPQTKPKRAGATRLKLVSHFSGFIFCCLGWLSEPALAGGLIMLSIAYLFNFLILHGDKYDIWYDKIEDASTVS